MTTPRVPTFQPLEHTWCDCQCSDFDHVFRFTLDPNDGDVLLEAHLNHYGSWWKRVWNAIRYVFKRPVAYGHYDVTMLKEEDYDRLRDLFRRSEIAKAGAVGRAREQLLQG